MLRLFAAAVLLASIAAPHTADSQSAPAPATKIVTLGTRSGPFPTGVRAQSSTALVVGDAIYLVDAGDGVARRLARASLSIRNVDAIFLTHLHDDHTTGIVPLMSIAFGLDLATPVGVYGPPQTEALMDAAIRFLSINSDIRQSEGTRTRSIRSMIAAHDRAPGLVFRDERITVRAVENSHFHFPAGSPSHGKTASYSYRVEAPGRSIVFTGDTGPSDALTEFAKGAEVLVTEINSFEELKAVRVKDGSWARWTPAQQASYERHMVDEHVSADEVARMAARAGVRTVILTHLPASGDARDDYARYAEAVRKGFSGQVLVAADLSVF